MQKKSFSIFIIAFIMSGAIGLAQSQSGYIIKFKQSESSNKELSSSRFKLLPYYSSLKNYEHKKNLPLNNKTREIINSLLSYRFIETNPKELKQTTRQEIINIEPNYTYNIEQDNTKPNDPRYYEQWALEALEAEKAWNKATGKGIIVGVVDTGIEWEHEDLMNQLWINSKEDINSNGKFDPWPSSEQKEGVFGDLNDIDDDGNGTIDDIIGYDFVNQIVANIGDWNTFDPVPIDENGHGTLISGVIAAEKNNNKGIVGLAYDSKIMTLRCFDITGNGTADNVASAIIYGVINGARVFNLSFGEKYNSSLMQDAINFALESGCVVIASSGNEGTNAPHYPSDYEGVISVGYSNKQGKRDNFSNYGSRLDLLAPGSKILTTSFVGDYRTASGSSLSAPFVSSTAAMLLELNSNLTSYDIGGIITESARDAGEKGWDIYYASGILDINRALDHTAITNMLFTHPENESVFNRDIIDTIQFTGSIVTPLIQEYELYLGEGYNPEVWKQIAVSDEQILRNNIYTLDIKDLKDTSYTFRIKVNLRNKNTIEKRLRFNISSNASKLKITRTKVLPGYYNNKRVIILGIETNKNSVITAAVSNPNDSTSVDFSDLLKKSKYHVVLIDDFLTPGIRYNCKIEASPDVLSENTSARTEIKLTISDDAFSNDKFIKKDYSTDLSYIYNKTADFNGDGKPEYVANNLNHGTWNGTDVYQYENSELVKRDSSNEIRIPVGIGDSNGDGILELFTRNVGSSVLYQPATSSSSLFSTILFADTTSGNFFAGEMYDYTGDGREELIAYSDTAVYILSYIDNKYQIIATAMLEGNLRRIGTAPGITCGDFDGDNKNELAFGNERGNIFIFEFMNNKLSLEYSNTFPYSFSPQYMTQADIDNDGIPEIAVANFGTQPLFGRSVSSEPVWTLKILKSISANQYGYIFGEYFYGVKQGSTPSGIFFRNGISAGNIGTEGDAVFMSPFPNFYTFTWNAGKRKMEPFWHYPKSFANSAIVYDFDGNGVNEFGFSTGSATEFFEYDKNQQIPNTPVEFEGWSISNDGVYLQWKPIAKDSNMPSVKYNLFYGIEKDGYIEIKETAETNETYFTFENLLDGINYWFGISSQSSQNISSDTSIILIHHHKPIRLRTINQLNQRRYKMKFTGKLSELLPEPSTFQAFSNQEIPAVALNRADDSTFIAYWSEPIPEGLVQFNINSFLDYFKAPSVKTTFEYQVIKDIPAPDELYLLKIRIISFYELELIYSEPVNIEESLNINNYTLSPLGKINSIIQTSNPSVVKIQLDDSSPIGALGKTYTLTVTNVHSLSSKKMTEGAGNSISFTFATNNLENVFVYPNPIRLSGSNPIYFANLTDRAEVYIYNLDGKELKILVESNGNGGVEWDGRNNEGNYLDSGIYLFNVKGKDENGQAIESGLKKFAIVR